MISSIPTLKIKTQLSAELALEVEAYLSSGGAIAEVPFGVGRESSAESYRDMQSKIATMKRASQEAT